YPFRCEIFAKLTVSERSANLLFPPPRVLEGVGVDRFIGSPVRLAIRLVISGKIYTLGCDPTDGRGFPDSTLGGTTVVFELAHATDVDGKNLPYGTCHQWPPCQGRLALPRPRAATDDRQFVGSPSLERLDPR